MIARAIIKHRPAGGSVRRTENEMKSMTSIDFHRDYYTRDEALATLRQLANRGRHIRFFGNEFETFWSDATRGIHRGYAYNISFLQYVFSEPPTEDVEEHQRMEHAQILFRKRLDRVYVPDERNSVHGTGCVHHGLERSVVDAFVDTTMRMLDGRNAGWRTA